MILNEMELDNMSDRLERALPVGSRLLGCRINGVLETGHMGIVYLADSPEGDGQCNMLEFFPAELAYREGDTVCAWEGEEFSRFCEEFLRRASILKVQSLTHCAKIIKYGTDHGTVCCAVEAEDVIPFEKGGMVMNAAYVQSLGVSLCDLYEGLAEHGIHPGRLRNSDLLIRKDGSILLHPAKMLFEGKQYAPVEAMYGLRQFLLSLLPDEDVSEEAETLRKTLGCAYADYAKLRKALLSSDGAVSSSARMSASWKPVLLGAVCLAVLAGSIALTVSRFRKAESLSHLLSAGEVTADSIEVWVPLAEYASEKDVVAMYQSLAEGFEKQYPDYEINISVYADGCFETAVAEDSSAATVFMDSTSPAVQELAADLTPLTSVLEDVFVADLHGFRKSMPLACSFPAVLYHSRGGSLPETESVSLETLDENAVWDASASRFASKVKADLTEDALSAFMADFTTEAPVVTSTSALSIVQNTPTASGDVRMYPLEKDGKYLMQYEQFCTVNKHQNVNKRQIGMLWIHYLLSDEAQQLMFVDHYSGLPLRQATYQQTAQNHAELAIAADLLTAADTGSLR